MSDRTDPSVLPTFRQIAHGSDEYAAACELRNRVLRIPLGLDLFREDLAAEVLQSHFALFDSAHGMLACVSVILVEPHGARIRQMAVQPGQQGKGYGRELMARLEHRLVGQGMTHLELHARVTAIAFYSGLGFSAVGERYLEVGIPHQTMVKDIPPESQAIKNPP